jgi:hypothetical protein
MDEQGFDDNPLFNPRRDRWDADFLYGPRTASGEDT